LVFINNYEEALKLIERLIEMDKGNPNYHGIKSLCLEKLGRYEEALSEINTFLESTNDFSNAWALKGSILLNLKDYESALECFDKAIMLDGTKSEYFYFKSMALTYLNQLEDALKTLDNVPILREEDERYWFLKAVLILGNERDNYVIQKETKNVIAVYKELDENIVKKLEESLDLINKAIEKNSLPIYIEHKIGILNQLGRDGDIEEIIDEAIKSNPDGIILKIAKISTFYNKKKYNKAIELADSFLAKDPINSDLLFLKGLAYEQLDELNLALKCYDEAINYDQNNNQLILRKGLVLLNFGNPKAVEVFDLLLNKEGITDIFYFSLMDAYRKLGLKEKIDKTHLKATENCEDLESLKELNRAYHNIINSPDCKNDLYQNENIYSMFSSISIYMGQFNNDMAILKNNSRDIIDLSKKNIGLSKSIKKDTDHIKSTLYTIQEDIITIKESELSQEEKLNAMLETGSKLTNEFKAFRKEEFEKRKKKLKKRFGFNGTEI